MATPSRRVRRSMSLQHDSKNLRPRILASLTITAVLWCVQAHAVFTVGPNSDTACQYHDIQSAVDAARQLGGPDVIQISQGSYAAQSTITVNDSADLHIEGGFESCSSGNRVGRSTLDAQGAQGGSLIVDTGSGSLTLLHLVLQNASTSGPGGGVYAVLAGPLALYDVLVYFNHAAYGGGLFVSGSDTFRMTLTLIDVGVNSNTADVNGGGLDVADADVTILGGSYFLANLANGSGGGGDGGGIWALDSDLHVTAHSPIPNPFIGFNQAARYGGGVYFAGTRGSLEFGMFNDSASAPLSMTHNVAQYGGALYMASSGTQVLSYADFWNVVIDDNIANDAPAIFMSANGQNTTTELRMEKSRPGDAIPGCTAGLECNAIRDHQQPLGGDLIALYGTDEAVAAFDMERGHLHDNDAGQLIFASQGYVHIDGSLLVSNTVGGDLIAAPNSTTHVANSTIANNSIGAAEVIFSPLTPALVELFNDIADQPGKALETLGNNETLSVRDILLSFGTTLGSGSGSNVQQGLPQFIDPANGNFHISFDSEAVDRSAASNDPADPPPQFDLDGGSRPHVFNSTTTPYDFGAYEYGSVVDYLFANGFDAP